VVFHFSLLLSSTVVNSLKFLISLNFFADLLSHLLICFTLSRHPSFFLREHARELWLGWRLKFRIIFLLSLGRWTMSFFLVTPLLSYRSCLQAPPSTQPFHMLSVRPYISICSYSLLLVDPVSAIFDVILHAFHALPSSLGTLRWWPFPLIHMIFLASLLLRDIREGSRCWN